MIVFFQICDPSYFVSNKTSCFKMAIGRPVLVLCFHKIWFPFVGYHSSPAQFLPSCCRHFISFPRKCYDMSLGRRDGACVVSGMATLCVQRCILFPYGSPFPFASSFKTPWPTPSPSAAFLAKLQYAHSRPTSNALSRL